jgi:membrane protein
MSLKDRIRGGLARVPGALPLTRLAVLTFRLCLRYRVTGLASEAGFFALLSLPPLVLGLFGGVGYVGQWLGPATVEDITNAIQTYASRFLTDDSVRQVIVPTVDDVLRNGRFDVISIGFLLSLWSGSRALNVFVDTISIMYGQSGVRGIVRTRVLSFTLYLVALLVGVVVIPLVLVGPSWLAGMLPARLQFLIGLYWPVVVVLTVASVATLFHVSTPRRSPWARDLPGAGLTLVVWLLSSFFLRRWLGASVGGTSIYGPLAAPIVVLIWLYFLAIAVLIGAALNAAARRLWPVEERPSSRARLFTWAREELARRHQPAHERPLTPMPELRENAPVRSQLDSDRAHRLMSDRTHGG